MSVKIDLEVSLTSFQGQTKTIAEWMEIRDIPEIFARYGAWAITGFGLECLTLPYDIAAARLWEKDGSNWGWTHHMSEKRWVVLADFEAAFETGRDHHKADK